MEGKRVAELYSAKQANRTRYRTSHRARPIRLVLKSRSCVAKSILI